MKKTILLFIVCIYSVAVTHAQVPFCTDTVPKDTIDFTGANAGTVWYSAPTVRAGSCCSSVVPDRCLDFIFITDSNTTAISFSTTSGTVPPGALYYRVDCGPQVGLNSAYPILNPGMHYLTFCKPGNNVNTYSIVSLDTTIYYIGGRVYEDANSNCIDDSGETGVPYFPVSLIHNGAAIQTTTTNLEGNYFFVNTGGYDSVAVDIAQAAGRGYAVTCPLSGQQNASSFPVTNADFGLECQQPGYDLEAMVLRSKLRPGRNRQIVPYFQNKNCQPVSGQAKLILSDSTLTYRFAYPSPDTIHGDTLIWNFSALTNGHLFTSYYVTVYTDSNAVIGDSVCIAFMVEPVAGDANILNNMVSQCLAISNSFDPNEKEVDPPGYGASGVVAPGTLFTYSISFQNTGTDTAYDVVILDTLDFDLDPSTFIPIAASHSYSVEILGNRILEFSFHDINLVDSMANEPLSHGWISYRIAPWTGLSPGTPILNRAQIYFDYNFPVATNTTLNTINVTTGIPVNDMANPFSIHPNPVDQNSFTISFDSQSKHASMIRIYDLIGKEIYAEEMPAGIVSQTIHLPGFPEGIYMMKVTIPGERTGSTRLVILR